MCGIVGTFGKRDVNKTTCYALSTLQHRGQDAAGIATLDQNRFYLYKNKGLVSEVFNEENLSSLVGNIAIGHIRYPTAGTSNISEAQPFYVNYPYGIMLATNGNLVNVDEIKRDIDTKDFRHINTDSDSEILINVLASALSEQREGKSKTELISKADIFKAMGQVFKRCLGAYAVVSIVASLGLVAFRDPNGIRPLVLGFRDTDEGREYMLASESVALSISGFELLRDVKPGEVIYIDMQGQLHTQCVADNRRLKPCAFEYVYLARQDSFIDGISVYRARMRLGEKLGEKILREYPDLPIDVVIPIPETSRVTALELAYRMGIKYREGFVKNRYIARTFIMPNQALREDSVRRKLSPLKIEFRNKNILLVDDSIVRGTTSYEIIKMVKKMGAKKIYFASAAPEIRYSNIYGIDMPSVDELIAHGKSNDDIKEALGVDEVIYQDLPDMIEALKHQKSEDVKEFETSVFDGEYIVGDIESYTRYAHKPLKNENNNLFHNVK